MSGFPQHWCIDSDSDDFLCCACAKIVNNPYQCGNGHLACFQCFKNAVAQKQTNCNIDECGCSIALSDISKSIVAEKLVKKLKCKCICAELSSMSTTSWNCDWVGTFEERTKQKECPNNPFVNCPLFPLDVCEVIGCTGKVLQTELDSHITEQLSVQQTMRLCGMVVVSNKQRLREPRSSPVNPTANKLNTAPGDTGSTTTSTTRPVTVPTTAAEAQTALSPNTSPDEDNVDRTTHKRARTTANEMENFAAPTSVVQPSASHFVQSNTVGGSIPTAAKSNLLSRPLQSARPAVRVGLTNSTALYDSGDSVETSTTTTKRITYFKGGVYIGETLDGKRHGHGKMTVHGISTHIGQWHNDQKHGEGKTYYPGKSVLEGVWEADRRHGWFVERDDSNNTVMFRGRYVNDRRSGMCGVHSNTNSSLRDVWYGDNKSPKSPRSGSARSGSSSGEVDH